MPTTSYNEFSQKSIVFGQTTFFWQWIKFYNSSKPGKNNKNYVYIFLLGSIIPFHSFHLVEYVSNALNVNFLCPVVFLIFIISTLLRSVWNSIPIPWEQSKICIWFQLFSLPYETLSVLIIFIWLLHESIYYTWSYVKICAIYRLKRTNFCCFWMHLHFARRRSILLCWIVCVFNKNCLWFIYRLSSRKKRAKMQRCLNKKNCT